MENDAGDTVDLYCPRKCSASNRIIHAKDHASIQLSIAEVDPQTGRMTENSKVTPFAELLGVWGNRTIASLG
ncbi:hypothetical protein NQ314_004140 [Rhamnusium bicolor]|uniref:Small ribosomal subunit protein eS21 n=1 Tax=Rhamnusium bicolor TaxID=1586634 RepID=A0AAV8ZK81_9CUCU|nr:hypothetical protein NQ314_004140 [Rhamnusium bicolor]